MDIDYTKTIKSTETLRGKFLEICIQKVNGKVQRISFNRKAKTSRRWLFTLQVLATKRDRETATSMLQELQTFISHILVYLKEGE